MTITSARGGDDDGGGNGGDNGGGCGGGCGGERNTVPSR